MEQKKRIHSALVSVFSKDGLEPIIRKMNQLGITLYSTGGTESFIKSLGVPVIPVEDITQYPSILGGRVKTLHPKIFGGILNRQDNPTDQEQMASYQIPQIDLVIVDLYPFEQTVASGASQQDIIEKIDIGGISLIRAAAKNFNDTLCVSSKEEYPALLQILTEANGETSLSERKSFALRAFATSSRYDTAIFNYFNSDNTTQLLRVSQDEAQVLRYGENPHQKGIFFGDFEALFTKLHGKELSYNNLLDVDAAVNLMNEFALQAPTFAILKHNNTCGIASRPTLLEAYNTALACDPVSAFGGILIANRPIDKDTAEAIKICKHTKSNTIVLVKNKQLLASGTGQTSRVDALKQAIEKAKEFNFSLQGAAMASDAFFPFPDCVEIAHKAGITSVIQPGGSIKDNLSIDYCNEHQVAMVMTGIRHFKH